MPFVLISDKKVEITKYLNKRTVVEINRTFRQN